MKITAIVENRTETELKTVHGLSLYIETAKHKMLFDIGPDNTVFENAAKLGIDLTAVDTLIISHGHYDHGGSLEKFLEINKTAKIYIQRTAFEPYYSRFLFFNVNVGLNRRLKDSPQIILLDGDYTIDDELSLFVVRDTSKCHSKENDALYKKGGRDDFIHEQNLIIKENITALIFGCGHTGVVNIMDRASEFSPELCVGGYHLYNPLTRQSVSTGLLDEIIRELNKYDGTEFYTCHCTGKKAYGYLSEKMPNMHYFSCGEIIER